MFVDASALIAIVAREPDHQEIAERLSSAKAVLVSPISLYESTTSLMRIGRCPLDVAKRMRDDFVRATNATTIPIDAKIGHMALEAFDRFGRGRHKAKLNFGDCFAYACAKAHKVPLLYKGRDFAHTDIEAA